MQRAHIPRSRRGASPGGLIRAGRERTKKRTLAPIPDPDELILSKGSQSAGIGVQRTVKDRHGMLQVREVERLPCCTQISYDRLSTYLSAFTRRPSQDGKAGGQGRGRPARCQVFHGSCPGDTTRAPKGSPHTRHLSQIRAARWEGKGQAGETIRGASKTEPTMAKVAVHGVHTPKGWEGENLILVVLEFLDHGNHNRHYVGRTEG